MQHLMLLSCQLREFLSGDLTQRMQARPAADSSAAVDAAAAAGATYNAYLAQVPIRAVHPGGRALQPGPLHALGVDAPVPAAVPLANLTQINFWASLAPSRSSCHYGE